MRLVIAPLLFAPLLLGATFWGGPLDAPGAHGPMTPLRAGELTRLIVREYFDQELRGRRSPLLRGTIKIPELSARRVRLPRLTGGAASADHCEARPTPRYCSTLP